MRFAAPAGDIDLPALPASAAGPDLRELLVGSEGVLGVICELDLRVREAPASRVYEGVFFEDFATGVAVLRALAQGPGGPTSRASRMSRRHACRSRSPAPETRQATTRPGLPGAARLSRKGLPGDPRLRGLEPRRRPRRGMRSPLARRAGGLPVGRSPGEAWAKGRFAAPYLRDELLDHGVMVETLETATQWSNLLRLHGDVRDAIEARCTNCGTPGLVMCHVSHLYETGASLYFTFLAAQQQGEELSPVAGGQGGRRAARSSLAAARSPTTTPSGATTRRGCSTRSGARAWPRSAALKAEVDPAAIMNPGKLLPEPAATGRPAQPAP